MTLLRGNLSQWDSCHKGPAKILLRNSEMELESSSGFGEASVNLALGTASILLFSFSCELVCMDGLFQVSRWFCQRCLAWLRAHQAHSLT
jgi:hypothetical protein